MPRKALPEKERFLRHVKKTDSCWIWTASKFTKGYGCFRNSNNHLEGAHRASYRMFVEVIPEGKCVMHTCDNPACVNPEHLRVGSNADNMQDRDNKKRGCFPGDENHPQTKLSARKVRRIRAIYETDKSWEMMNRLAKRFGVSPETVSKAARRETWKNV